MQGSPHRKITNILQFSLSLCDIFKNVFATNKLPVPVLCYDVYHIFNKQWAVLKKVDAETLLVIH